MKANAPEKMSHLIDKDAIVTEIERRIKNLYPKEGQGMVVTKILKDHYEDLLDFLNTLEVKEVDLEKEINKYVCYNFFGSQTMGFFANRTKEEPNDQDIALCAIYFFELGLKVQKGEKV